MVLNVAVLVRNGIAMRIDRWITQKSIQSFRQEIVVDMLQFFGKIMYFIPLETQFVNQESFPQTMSSDQATAICLPVLVSVTPWYLS